MCVCVSVSPLATVHEAEWYQWCSNTFQWSRKQFHIGGPAMMCVVQLERGGGGGGGG